MKNSYDAIIVGAGSIGLPLSVELAQNKLKVLVIDKNASYGQGENKEAIGGIRATHSDPAKILTCLRSLEIISSFKEVYGDDINWRKGGYCFPVYRTEDEQVLKNMLPIQKEYGLNIDFVKADKIKSLINGISEENLIGGTFSPNDGTVSPLLLANAYYKRAVASKVDFAFNEKVLDFEVKEGRIKTVVTDKGQHFAPIIIDACGPYSRELGQKLKLDIKVFPDSHEAGITEPVQKFFDCMVVDIRPFANSKNYYFYQNNEGQIIFCLTPEPPILGMDKNETSTFLPQIAKLMINLLPRLKNIRVRRVWRGLYPMTPDGVPLVGWSKEFEGLFHATGMCGQGLMLGVGLAETISRTILGNPTAQDEVINQGFSLTREFKKIEALK